MLFLLLYNNRRSPHKAVLPPLSLLTKELDDIIFAEAYLGTFVLYNENFSH
jgi:hypothetical protein